MNAGTDAAMRGALREVNAAFVQLPIQLRDRLDVSSPAADDAVTDALRSGGDDAALAAIEAWRDAHLATIAKTTRSTRCAGDSSPMVMADEHDEGRCLRCGRAAA